MKTHGNHYSCYYYRLLSVIIIIIIIIVTKYCWRYAGINYLAI